jgi:acetyltransferase-like isoleucine patch superfamily enzyme
MINRIKYLLVRIYWALQTRRLNKLYNCEIDRSTGLNASTVFKGKNKIWSHTAIFNSEIGYMTYVGDNCKLPSIKIGKYCSLADHIELILGNHPTSVFVSTYPAFYLNTPFFGKVYTDKKLFEDYSYADNDNKWLVTIGNDVWVGKGAKIKNGVRIGDGAIIASYAVVVKDVPPYAIVGGVPAKVIRYRFEPDEIDWLLNFKWWDKDDTWIEKHAQYFKDIRILMDCVEKER